MTTAAMAIDRSGSGARVALSGDLRVGGVEGIHDRLGQVGPGPVTVGAGGGLGKGGNDRLDGGSGNDRVDGGPGDDLVRLPFSTCQGEGSRRKTRLERKSSSLNGNRRSCEQRSIGRRLGSSEAVEPFLTFDFLRGDGPTKLPLAIARLARRRLGPTTWPRPETTRRRSRTSTR